MRYFKLAYDIFTNKFMFNLLVILEIFAMLILTNTVIATYNSKKMLYEPYREILSHNGVVFISAGFEEGFYDDKKEIQDIYDKYGNIYYPAIVEMFKKNLKGNTEIIYTINNGLKSEIVSTMEGYDTNNVNCFYIDHKIFEKLRMPLSAGRWASSETNENGEIEIVISGGTNAVLDKVYDTDIGKIKIVGILTDNTYVPPAEMPESINDKLSIFNYYKPFDCNISTRAPFALIDQNLCGDKNNPIFNSAWFISYEDGLSEEDIAYNNNYLKQFGQIRDVYGEENFSTLSEQSEKYLNDIYTRMLPIVIASAVVILAGLIGSVAISTVRQIKNFGILFLCGCRWKDCTRIIIAYLTILFSIAVVLTILCISVMKIVNMDYLIGSVYEMNNLVISIAEIAVMYLLAIILPHNIIKTTSPVETIKEN